MHRLHTDDIQVYSTIIHTVPYQKHTPEKCNLRLTKENISEGEHTVIKTMDTIMK